VESGKPPKSVPKVDIRDALRKYLQKHYPVPNKTSGRKP